RVGDHEPGWTGHRRSYSGLHRLQVERETARCAAVRRDPIGELRADLQKRFWLESVHAVGPKIFGPSSGGAQLRKIHRPTDRRAIVDPQRRSGSRPDDLFVTGSGGLPELLRSPVGPAYRAAVATLF